MRQPSQYANLTRRAREYVEDYEYVLSELRSQKHNTYGMAITTKNGNMDARYQAEKDFEYERRISDEVWQGISKR